MAVIKNRYNEVFEVEMDGWCYGIANYPGEVFPGLIHRVIKEIGPVFQSAITNHYCFNVLDLSAKLSKAAKYLVSEKEIAFSILSFLPNPALLNETERGVLTEVVDQVEKKYGGALRRLNRRWHLEMNLKSAA